MAIISDLHGNLAALRAVIADGRRKGVDRTFCLGDVVGYNAHPRATIDLIRALRIPTVVGNHDLMAIGQLDPDDCGPNARAAILWTRTVLSHDDVAYLRSLPDRLPLEPEAICVHSGLDDPVVRLRSDEQFREQCAKLRALDRRIRVCFTGHTHVPGAVEISPSGTVAAHRRAQLHLRDGSFYFVNPGSVGLPRASDYRASYAIYDRDEAAVTFLRVAYDREETIRENAKHGLHPDLGPSVAGYAVRRALETARRVGARVKASL